MCQRATAASKILNDPTRRFKPVVKRSYVTASLWPTTANDTMRENICFVFKRFTKSVTGTDYPQSQSNVLRQSGWKKEEGVREEEEGKRREGEVSQAVPKVNLCRVRPASSSLFLANSWSLTDKMDEIRMRITMHYLMHPANSCVL